MASGVVLILSITLAPAVEAASKASVRAVKSAPTAYTSAKAPTAPAEAAEVVDTAPEPGCSRARKKLWVEGEGWIVRRVTTCF
jgi:nucleoid-associated protein YgaU